MALAVIAPLVLFAVLFQAAAMRGVLFTDMTAQIGALQTIPAFLFGAALCRLSRERSLPGGWGAVLATVAGGWIIAASLLRLSDLALFPAFGALVYGLAEATKASGPGPADAALAYLGRIAHAIYLVYLPVDIIYFHGVEQYSSDSRPAPGAWAVWAGVFPVILLVGIAAHHLIQAPIAALPPQASTFPAARTAPQHTPPPEAALASAARLV